jgi:hypothetical protein
MYIHPKYWLTHHLSYLHMTDFIVCKYVGLLVKVIRESYVVILLDASRYERPTVCLEMSCESGLVLLLDS